MNFDIIQILGCCYGNKKLTLLICNWRKFISKAIENDFNAIKLMGKKFIVMYDFYYFRFQAQSTVVVYHNR